MDDDPDTLSTLIRLLSREASERGQGVDVKRAGEFNEVKIKMFGKVFSFRVPAHNKFARLLLDPENKNLRLATYDKSMLDPYNVEEAE